MSGWTIPTYTRGQVDRAAKVLTTGKPVMDAREAFAIISNWRSSHSYPLTILKQTLQNRARKVDGNSISAQRLKRLSSIAVKLKRNKHMKFSQMQDIGGCRAVLNDVHNVDSLVEIYEETLDSVDLSQIPRQISTSATAQLKVPRLLWWLALATASLHLTYGKPLTCDVRNVNTT